MAKLITRGYGSNQQIITKGYGSGIIAKIIETAQGAANAILTDTLTIVRFNITQYQSLKVRFHIGKFSLSPFETLFNIKHLSRKIGFNLLVHHFDIRTSQLISTIRTAAAVVGLSTNYENLSK